MNKQVLIDKLINLNDRLLVRVEELKGDFEEEREDYDRIIKEQEEEADRLAIELEGLTEKVYEITGVSKCYSPIEAIRKFAGEVVASDIPF